MSVATTRSWPVAVAVGVALGVAYTLSPLAVLSLAAFGCVLWWACRELSLREREWFLALVLTAFVVRLIVIAGLVLLADSAKPWATFFGDEELFKSRSVWIRNIGLGVPVSRADMIYAYDDTGKSGYLFVLAYIQALVGDTPYGVHVLNAVLYLNAAVILFRVARAAYGSVPATVGLAVLLFLPSLFVWSISALKEPSYVLVAAGELVCALQIARARTWRQRALVAAGVVVLSYELGDLRKGGELVAALGAIAGVSAGLALERPRAALVGIVALPLAAAVVFTRPTVQQRLLTIARESARYHVGHVLTPGVSYKLVEPRFYADPRAVMSMSARDAAAFAIKAPVRYIIEPLPGRATSRMLLAYLPEHVMWIVLVALAPVGFLGGLHREPVLTCLLGTHAFAVMMMVALTSGNVGTLIRHRGLVLPYIVWLSAFGLVRLVSRALKFSRPCASGVPHASG